MTQHSSYCPGCKQDVVFQLEGDARRCPNCGFGYLLNTAKPVGAGGVFETLGKIFHGLMMAVLVLGGIVCLAVGVFFAGCLFRMW